MTIRGNAPALWVMAAALGSVPGLAGAAEWQETESEFVRVNAQGDLATSSSPIPGPVHTTIDFGVASADYFRGAFDGVQEDPHEVAGSTGLATTFEIVDRPGAGLSGLSITGGTANGLTNGGAADQGTWYESDNYAGIAAEFGDAWQTGLTYTYYASPHISGSDPLQEVAASARYAGDNIAGRLAPQLKIAKPVDETEGYFTQFSLRPSFEVAKMRAGPVEVALPMEVGAGFDNYYGSPDGETGVYGLVGAEIGVPLGVPASYGNWRASAGVNGMLRDDTIQAAGGPRDDGGDTVITGMLRLSLTY